MFRLPFPRILRLLVHGAVGQVIDEETVYDLRTASVKKVDGRPAYGTAIIPENAVA